MEKLYTVKTGLGTYCGSDHELLIAKFRLKLKRVGKTIRSSRYDLNQIPYNYTVNHELPDVQAGFRKDRLMSDQIANIHWIIKKAREFKKSIYFCFIDYAKVFDCVDHKKLWEILKEICMQLKKQQLEPDMEQRTGSKSGKEYVTAVYCHPAYSTYQRRQWHPTPVFLPGESQARGSPVGCHLWGRTELDTT